MPVIHTFANVAIPEETRRELSKSFGKVINTIPGKSETWLMCIFHENTPISFAGDFDRPVAYVEINSYGQIGEHSTPFEELSIKVQNILNEKLHIPHDRMYIRETATLHWGWNSNNFPTNIYD